MGFLDRVNDATAKASGEPVASELSAAETQSGRDRAAANGAPVGWDYRTVVMGHGIMGWHKDEINRSDLETQLDQLGREGWELVHVWFDQKLHREKDGHLMVFKRPVFARSAVEHQG
jgi:hypothetical protein